SLSFSADSSLLATGGNDKSARVWSVASVEVLHRFVHPRDVRSVSLSADGTALLTTDGEDARLFDLGTDTQRATLSQKGSVTSASMSPDGKYVVTGGSDDLAVLWNSNGQQLATLKGHHQDVLDAEFSPDGRLAVTASA